MKNRLLVYIDFQNCFLSNEIWGVPDFDAALHCALSFNIGHSYKDAVPSKPLPAAPCTYKGHAVPSKPLSAKHYSPARVSKGQHVPYNGSASVLSGKAHSKLEKTPIGFRVEIFGLSKNPRDSKTAVESMRCENVFKIQHRFNRVKTITTRYIPPFPIEGAWIEYYKALPDFMQNKNDKCYDLVTGVPTKLIIDVPKFGKWSAIRDKLDERIVQLYITGVSTDCCVLSTALEAADDGIEVFIIEDACAGSSREQHIKAINIMKGYSPNIKIILSKDLNLINV